MVSFLRWLFWCNYYAVCGSPTDFAGYLKRSDRRWAPWKKFRASVFRNHDGNCWEVYLQDGRSTVIPGVRIVVDVHVSDATGCVVGLIVHDHDLQAAGLKTD